MESITAKYVVMNASGRFLSSLYRNSVGTVDYVGGGMLLESEHEACVIAEVATRTDEKGKFAVFKVETRMVPVNQGE